MARGPLVTDRTRYALLLSYVVVTFLSFPQPAFGTVIDLGAWLGWFSPALLILALWGTEPRRAAKLGFLAGTAAQTAVLHWLYIVSVDYGHAPAAIGLLGPLGMGAHTGVFFALFSLSFAWFERNGCASPWLVAGLWTTVELLRAAGPIGFPWSTIGYTQHHNSALLGIASYTGVYGLSFATALGGAAIARAVVDGYSARRISGAVWIAAACVAALHAAGAASFALGPAADAGSGSVRVAVLQGNIDQGVKWNRNWVERTVVIYEELSREAAALGAEVIVFPESAVPGALNSDTALRYRLSRLAQQTGATYVVGSIARESQPGQRTSRFFDSAFVLQSDGKFADRYDKSHLVPFGEYVPFGEWIGWIFKAVAQGMAVEGVTRGPGPRAVSLVVASLDSSPLTAGVPICYELIFPDRTRRFVRDGAQLLLAITNDAWYGRTGAPHQFLAMTAVRSAENGVWTARAANTGVSAFIDSHGRVREQTAIFERGLLVEDVPLLDPQASRTFYARYGDAFAYLCGAAVAAMAVAVRLRSRVTVNRPD